jgi:hypothetical protein
LEREETHDRSRDRGTGIVSVQMTLANHILPNREIRATTRISRTSNVTALASVIVPVAIESGH